MGKLPAASDLLTDLGDARGDKAGGWKHGRSNEDLGDSHLLFCVRYLGAREGARKPLSINKSARPLAGQRTDDAVANAYGLGRCCQAGFWGTVGFRFLTGCDGSADTTSGTSRVRSVRSIAVISARDASESIGARKTRTASSSQTGHDDLGVAVPIGRRTSKSPSWTHRYWYVATRNRPPSCSDCGILGSTTARDTGVPATSLASHQRADIPV